jgi:hypothetical protein
MGVTRSEGFNANILADDDGNVISSTLGTTSTTVAADGIKRLCVDANIAGGSITVLPTPNRSTVQITALNPGAGIATQCPSQAVPDGFATVFKNRSTVGAVGGQVFIANSLANCAISGSRIELEEGESVSFKVTNWDIIFFSCQTDATVIELFSET